MSYVVSKRRKSLILRYDQMPHFASDVQKRLPRLLHVSARLSLVSELTVTRADRSVSSFAKAIRVYSRHFGTFELHSRLFGRFGGKLLRILWVGFQKLEGFEIELRVFTCSRAFATVSKPELAGLNWSFLRKACDVQISNGPSVCIRIHFCLAAPY